MTTSVPRLSYLSLEPLREGHASHTHVMEIIAGLRAGGCHLRLFAPAYDGAGLPSGLRRLWAMALTTLRFLFSGRADVFYARWHFAALPAVLWAKLWGMKVVIEVNGPVQDLFIAWPWTRRLGSFFPWLMATQLRQADAIIAVTPGLLDYALEKCLGARKPIGAEIANGANTDLFRPDLPRPDGVPDRYAIFVGTLAPWQGVQTMLEAISRPDWPADLHLLIAGDGALRAEVMAVAAKDPRVHFLGRVPYRDLPAIIAHASAGLVMTVNVEGRADTGVSPLKLFENMACGIPVIVADVPGPGDLIRARDGLAMLVRPDDPAGLNAALGELLGDPVRAQAMGAAAAAWVHAEQSWAVRARDTRAVIDRILT